MRNPSGPVWLLALIPAGFFGVWQLQHRIDVERVPIDEANANTLLQSPQLVKAMSLEYSPLVADYYWTRAVQYFGSKKDRGGDLKNLWPLLNIATTLDPHLLVAYHFGSVFLSDGRPRGAGQPEKAVELLDRGIAANPGYWRLYYDLGFVYYFDMRDYPKAAAAFQKGSENPQSAVWMKILAARIYAQGASYETSAFMWNEVYESATDPNIKDNARVHLKLLRADQDIDRINALTAEYQEKKGRAPSSIRDLIEAGFLPNQPVDPEGYPYVLGRDGEAELDQKSPLQADRKLYDKPI